MLSFGGVASAQTNTGEVQGIVKDPLGGLLPGAVVSILHRSSGLRIDRVSDENGRFFVSALPVGDYAITITLEGFRSVTESGLILRVGERLEIAITLPIGQRTESLTVTAATPLLQTANAEVSDIIDNRQVVQLPLNGRQFLQLAQLTDGVDDSARRDARRRARAGRPAAERLRTARRPQHLSARRREGDRRATSTTS